MYSTKHYYYSQDLRNTLKSIESDVRKVNETVQRYVIARRHGKSINPRSIRFAGGACCRLHEFSDDDEEHDPESRIYKSIVDYNCCQPLDVGSRQADKQSKIVPQPIKYREKLPKMWRYDQPSEESLKKKRKLMPKLKIKDSLRIMRGHSSFTVDQKQFTPDNFLPDNKKRYEYEISWKSRVKCKKCQECNNSI